MNTQFYLDVETRELLKNLSMQEWRRAYEEIETIMGGKTFRFTQNHIAKVVSSARALAAVNGNVTE